MDASSGFFYEKVGEKNARSSSGSEKCQLEIFWDYR